MFRLVVLCWSGWLPVSARGQGLGSRGRGGADPAASLMAQVEGRTVCALGRLLALTLPSVLRGHAVSCAEPPPRRAGARQGAAHGPDQGDRDRRCPLPLQKFWEISRQIHEFMTWTRVECPFEKDKKIQNYLLTAPIYSEEGEAAPHGGSPIAPGPDSPLLGLHGG